MSAFAAGSLLATVLGLPGHLAAETAPPQVSLSVTTANKPVGGDRYVTYDQRGANQAKLQGTATNPPAGASVALLSSVFPYDAPSQPIATATLNPAAGKDAYSFTVTPTLATRYFVELLGSVSDPGVLARSTQSVVYVAADLVYSEAKQAQCSRPECHRTFSATVTYPTSVAATESAKHWNTYFGLALLPVAAPAPPTWLHLRHNWKVGRTRLLRPGVYKTTFRLEFRIGEKGFDWRAAVCTRDTESVDGLGLPGHHSCGAGRIRTKQFATGYVG
jgi:hypothetical protein